MRPAAPSSPLGRVFDLQRFSVHDGPGIRSTVFLAGCPLRCAWCHNPESFVGHGAAWRSVEAVMAEVRCDRDFHRESGGGLTVSGGEPLLQPTFVVALLGAAGAEAVHRCVQTSGAVPWDALEAILDRVELIQFDLKHADDARHRALTGRGNGEILENARRLVQRGAPVEFRMPLVPGANDDADALAGVARVASALGVGELSVVPYQDLYLEKYRRLGLEARWSGVAPPTEAARAAAVAALQRAGLRVRH